MEPDQLVLDCFLNWCVMAENAEAEISNIQAQTTLPPSVVVNRKFLGGKPLPESNPG